MKIKAVLLLTGIFMAEWGFGQCSGLEITVDKTQQCAPGIIRFTINNQPSGSTIQWDFGNGWGTSADTAFEFFLDAKVINARALVTFSGGSQCTIDSQSIARVLAKPTPKFEVSRTKLCDGPDTVTFVNTTPNTKEISWIVDGSNYPKSTDTLIHDFKSSGLKDISLIVEDSFGCTSVKVFKDVVTVHPDIDLEFTADVRTGCVTKSVNISPNISQNGETIVSYQWNFEGAENGIQYASSPTTLTYKQSGEYDASISVVTQNGCTHFLKKENYFQFGDSINLNVKFSSQLSCVGDSIIVTAQVKENGLFKWNLSGNPGIREVTPKQLYVSYDNPGSYGLALEMSNNGCFSKIELDSVIQIKEVKANFFSSDYYHCYRPHISHFTNLSAASHNQVMTYEWSYIDEAGQIIHQSTLKNDSINITEFGRYDVQLVVKDMYGCSDTVVKHDHLRVLPIKSNFLSEEFVGCVGQEITLQHKTPKSSYLSTDTFNWTIYDSSDSLIFSGSGPEFKNTFNKVGFYHVRMIAANTIGCIDTSKKNNYIEIIESKPEFRVDDTVVCAAQNYVYLKAESKPTKANFSFAWNIRNQNDSSVISVGFDTTHIQKILIHQPGKYSVSYIHRINQGCYDTLIKKDLIQVNGIKGHIKLDKKFGCEGTIISPKFVTTTNVHESSPVDSLIYSWGATPFSSENLLENYATPAPSIQLSKAGLYNISMRVTNSTGCRLNISSDTIQIGIKADFNANKYELCVNDTVLITSNSTSFINFREWTVSGDGQFDFDTLGKFIPHENGQYKIRLIAGYNQQCFDTITKDFQSVKVTSRFNTFNSDLLCAPAYAQFVSESQNADSLFWDFGDGTNLVTTDLSVATIYQRNTVPGKGYVVSLIAHNELGCADTFVSPYPVNVIGPQPKIQLENFNGCEPLNVRFKHQHSGATSILLNFRDGSELDTSITNSHVYFVKNGSLEQKFIPSVYAIDSLGCSAIAESKDTIVVRKSPILPGLDTALSSCFPGNIDQNYFDPEVLEYRWNLNDSFISHKPRVIQSDLAAGTYKLELQVFNQLGCSDTNIRTFQIHPLPEISLNDGNFCLNVPGTLSASITNNNPDSLSWKWFMESPDSTYESHTNSCLVTFSVPDNHRIIVEATDQNQCMGHASNRFLVHSPDSIPVGSINYTTFNEANDLLVNWDNNTSEFVASQQLIDGNGNLIVGQGVQSNPEYRLTYKGIIPTVCFRLLNADDCGYQGMPSGEHCAMILRTATPAPYTVSLNWSRYAGWDNIAFQLLYRKKANGAYEEVAKLDGNALSYTDSMLCDDSYIYFIEAHHADGRITQSNRSLAKPKYISNELPIDVEVVSVKNEAIEVSWLPAQSSNIQHYRLEKMDSTGFYVLDTKIFDAQTTNFLDQNVQVNDASYRYRLTSTDHCGSESNPGLYGKSILLRAQYSDHKSTLTWNSYEQWQDGVKHYLVQLKTPNGYETLATVPGNVLYYTDREVHKEVKGEYCYRICAVSYFDSIQSLSNQVCIFGESFMWIPNAFSPNEDDLNTVFRPTANFINMVQDGTYQTYEMKIYNRWGELLFRTTDINEGWDGSYRGEQTPPSSYVYHIRAKGLDNVIYNYKGTIRLMR